LALYEYKALDGGGKAVSGVIDADSPKTARARLRKQGIFPTDVAAKKEGAVSGQGLNVNIDFEKYFLRVSTQDIAQFTSQLSTLVGASIPLVDALSALVEQTENRKLKEVLVDVRAKVNEGSSMAKALRSHTSVFSDLFINMVDAGEQSGALEVVLRRLEEYTLKQVAMQGKLQGALAYPILMSGLSLLLVVGLFTQVLPRIRRIFDSFDATLPILTRVLFSVSNFLVGYWWLALGLAGLSIWGFIRYIRSPKGRIWWHQRQLRFPVFGRINRIVAVSRFCRTLSTLLDSGVPVLTALGITQSVVGNDIIAKAVGQASLNISEGQSIAGPLKQSGEFPPIVTHMITVGEKTGELEAMLSKVADAYDLEVENTLEALTSLLTPILMLVMGGVVMIIALGVLLPLMQLGSVVSHH
jgi:general secretion pathway protein F